MQGKQEKMKHYIVKNPNSYVALWDMVLDYPFIRNNKDKERVLRNTKFFSAKIRKTKTYQALVNNIRHDLELNVGKIFPNIPLNESDSLFRIISKNKFTLVDFWFSGCEPCIAQFPYYKKVYNAFKKSHFEIVGVSVDIKKHTGDWQKVIQKLELNWLQYLDTNGKETDKLFIRKFPTNFLMNSNGEIIKTDISPENLETFLQKNLN
jgi:thiol-disulfide isomerase/thioredoxin